MDRREALRVLGLATAAAACGCFHFLAPQARRKPAFHSESESDLGEVHAHEPAKEGKILTPDARAKSVYFDQDFADDIFLSGPERKLAESLLKKLRLAQSKVGYGNFNILGFDDFLKITAAGAAALTPEEAAFMEKTFHTDAKIYGFQGAKVFTRLNEAIGANSVVKIAGTGHYLRKGKSTEVYNRIIKDVGSSLVLTSGVRGLVKQYYLFFEKCLQSGGNLSKASRSLAPPGYSFHGHGDFDIGKRGFGLSNFTDEFAATEEYKRLVGLGYAEIRYVEENQLGVRFEPWHIKVASG
jgi:D-alanyl-D-alanine carboxypeptidase